MKQLLILILLSSMFVSSAQAARIKDIAAFDGVRDNQLAGYGLIVGLNGSGDSDQTKFPVQSLVSMLERMGVTVNRNDVKVKNVAAVMVTATLPPFAKQGTKLATMVECPSCKAKAMVLAKNGHSFTFCTCGKQHKV